MSLFYYLQINKLLRSIKQTKHSFCAKVLVHKRQSAHRSAL